MIRRLQVFLHAFKIRTLFIALSVFVAGNLALNYFFLSPSQEMVRAAEGDLEEMKETYIQLKSTDLSEISKSLQQQIDYLNEKQKKITSSHLTNAQIPVFVSRLELAAETAGLTVRTKIKRQEKKSNLIAIDVDFTGTILELFSYLNRLERWEELLFVKNFRIYNKNSSQNILNGKMEFIVLVENK
ncbi:hypothetical protein IH785_13610 [candidate division KSB1 bacterium]|nr:hypothetical protein [candidate division KSB1 bacterium]